MFTPAAMPSAVSTRATMSEGGGWFSNCLLATGDHAVEEPLKSMAPAMLAERGFRSELKMSSLPPSYGGARQRYDVAPGCSRTVSVEKAAFL